MSILVDKKILLGVTGSIAAYKSPEIVRRLRELGAIVRVAMTENAKQFITPLTLQAVSGHPVHDNLFDCQAEAAMGHIELARWADVILIAPASADSLARLAHGRGDDLLTAVCLATRAPIAIAPAMNQGMWEDQRTQDNLNYLKQKSFNIFGPGEGSQACGEVGLGRMLEPTEILAALPSLFIDQPLSGCEVIITAGPTQEPIDPVRYLSNRSSGKMGYALAQAALEAGAKVVLISGPVQLVPPVGVEYLGIRTGREMLQAVMQRIAQCDIFLGVAAVSDYTIDTPAPQKIAKTSAEMALQFIRNADIIREVANLDDRPFVVGFAAETSDVIAKATRKRLDKKMDIIIANQVSDQLGMERDENAVTLIGEGWQESFPLMSKKVLARKMMTLVAKYYQKKRTS